MIATCHYADTSVSSISPSLMGVVDGGGSGTRVRLITIDFRCLAEGHAGPSLLLLGEDVAWRNIKQAFHNACTAADIPPTMPYRLVAGLAGSRTLERREKFLAHVAQDNTTGRSIDMTLVSDAYASTLGALGGEPGIVIAIGTGVAACRIDHTYQSKIVSGWGFKGGDEGSGAWIGQRAVWTYLKQLDGRLPQSGRLSEVLAERIGTQVSDIQNWLAKAFSTEFASLAQCIVELAKEGDVIAEEIVYAAIREIEICIAALEVEGIELPIALLGGLASSFSPLFNESIRQRMVEPKGNALMGCEMILDQRCPPEASYR